MLILCRNDDTWMSLLIIIFTTFLLLFIFTICILSVIHIIVIINIIDSHQTHEL